MSYCRWSCNDFQCDLYVYESAHGFEIHVASNRRVYKEPLPPPCTSPVGSDAWWARHQKVSAMLEDCVLEPIGLPCDGESYTEDSAEDALARIEELLAMGYRGTEHLVAILKEEIADGQ